MAATSPSRNHHAVLRAPALSFPADPSKRISASAPHAEAARRRLTASACSSSPLCTTSTACGLPSTRCGPQGAATLRPASGQLPRRSSPTCYLPQPRGVARRAPMHHAATAPDRLCLSPSRCFVLGRSYSSDNRPPMRRPNKRPPLSPRKMGAAGPLPLDNSVYLLSHHATGTPCDTSSLLSAHNKFVTVSSTECPGW